MTFARDDLEYYTQMDSKDAPSPGMLGVLFHSNSILQARRRAGLLRSLMFVHLKQDLGAEPVGWFACQDRSDPLRRDPLLPYGIQREVQQRLAAIRTDLDSFAEAGHATQVPAPPFACVRPIDRLEAPPVPSTCS